MSGVYHTSNNISEFTGFYVYVYLDPRKPGRFQYSDVSFLFEPFYVGKGSKGRLYSHLKRYPKGHRTAKIRRIRAETGKDPFVVCLYPGGTEEEAFQLESRFVAEIGRDDLGTGTLVNKTDGGEGSINPNRSDEWRKAISTSLTGKRHSAETKAKMTASRTGHPTSQETKKKISDANKNRIRKRGWNHTEETKAKMRQKKSSQALENMRIAQQKRQITKPMSQETKDKIRATLKARHNNGTRA